MARLPLSPGLSAILFNLLISCQAPGKRRQIPSPIADALHCIDRQLTNCVVISSTGSGKALTWQVGARVAALDRQFIILVVPYVALLTDVVRTCLAKKITAKEWRAVDSANTLSSRPNVVIVSLNRAVSSEFLQWTGRVEVRTALRTVFVDECHVMVEETFRRAISDFARLTHVLAEKQFVFLTATLSPFLEKDLERQICLPVKIFREATHRTNLAYSVKRAVHIQEALTLAKVKIGHVLRISPQGSQVLVICKTVGEAIQAGAFLDCPVYHASLSDDVAAESKLPSFLRGELKVLAGTTAAGVGIDVAKIALVVFLGEPYSIASFAQGVGRAGRDGRRAEAVIYRIGVKAESPLGGPLPTSDGTALAMLLSGRVCMQQPLTHWLDGRMSSCIELGTEFCSVCRVEEAVHKPSADQFDDFVHSSPQPSQGASSFAASFSDRAVILSTPRGTPLDGSQESSARTDSNESNKSSETRSLTRKARPWQEPQTPQTSVKRGRVDLDTDLFGLDAAKVWFPVTPKPKVEPPTTPIRSPKDPSIHYHPSSFPRTSNHVSSAGGFRGGSLGLGRGRGPVRAVSVSHLTADPAKGLRTLSEIGNKLHPGMGGLSEHLERQSLPRPTSPPATSVARMVTPDPEYAQQLANFETYQRLVREALPRAVKSCPMCFMLERDDAHRPGSCKMDGVSWASQQTFREHPDNNWGSREACFYCNLPQVICGRANQEKTCPYRTSNDSVRGILLLLTIHSGVRRRAVQVATQINPDYQLSEPVGNGRMGASWRRPAPFGNDVTMYRAFQAVAAVLLMMGGAFTF